MLLSNFSGLYPEAGCDEAGRGCIAGPVVAAAVIFPENYTNAIINDSKKLNAKKREELSLIIKEDALTWAVAFVEHDVIDQINILNASILAMQKALQLLKIEPEYIIVDGNRFKSFKKIPYSTIVKGDGKYISIAAASIIAKTERDKYMEILSKQFPHYKWNKNKGYPTLDHQIALAQFGQSPLHRKSFHLKNQIRIPFDSN